MTDKTHQLLGLTAAVTGFMILHPNVAMTWPLAGTIIIGSFFGSIAPDFDQPTASIWHAVPLGGIVGKITSRSLGGHRHVSHSLLGIYLFYLAIHFLAFHLPATWFIDPNLLVESFVIGFAAHLVADSVTVEGVPIFWPFGNNMGFPPHPFEGIRIITGKWFENLVVLPLTALSLVLIVIGHQTIFCSLIFQLCH